MKRKEKAKDLSTEERIKNAARTVFMKKGFAATRTRDIAEEAGMNLALLNYYFRSKEKLFHLVMEEKFLQFFGIVVKILNNERTSIKEKVEQVAHDYIELLMLHPELPLFVMGEIRNNPELFGNQVKHDVFNSYFAKQLKEVRPDINFLHFLINLVGMAVFPFIAKPVLTTAAGLNEVEFKKIMEERKKMIPKWFESLLHLEF